MYTNLKVVLKINKNVQEVVQSVSICKCQQGDNVAPVLFLFLSKLNSNKLELGGPVGPLPPNSFCSGRNTQRKLSRSHRKKATDNGLTGGSDFVHDLFPPPLPPPPLIQEYHSLNKGIGIFLDVTA